MPDQRKVYLLNPKELSPETIAVSFGKTSRSPLTFQEIANELSEESSAAFHEKWVVGYGHASVAEHAVLHLAIENISRLAVETLEGNRLASYTEKSTRYQKWTPDNYYTPSELAKSPSLHRLYQKTCTALFDAYQQALPVVKKTVELQNPQQAGESEHAWQQRIRTEYIDVCRFLLPACSIANVGVTMNARSLEYAICKMLSHPLDEVRKMGEEIKIVAQKEVPTLVKYAEPSAYLKTVYHSLREVSTSSTPLPSNRSGWCNLVHFDTDADNRVLASVLYRFGTGCYEQYLDAVKKMTTPEKEDLARSLLTPLTKHDIPLRELEFTEYCIDLTLDQGAYFELKRHRMMTQTPQTLNPDLGFTLPKKIVQAGFKEKYIQMMEEAASAYHQLYSLHPDVASYVIPNAYNRRVLLKMNLRTAFHLFNLRTAPNAHFSIRRAVLRIMEEIKKTTPVLTAFLNTQTQETWQQIEDDHFEMI